MISTFIPEQFFDGHELHQQRPISIEDGRVISFDTVKGAKEFRLKGLLAPGFIDTQVNGGGGFLLNHDISVNTLEAMTKAHAIFGTSGMLPTLITSDLGKISDTATLISKAIKRQVPGVLGVHFEGPHISEPKKGIHNSQQIRPITQQEMDVYCRDDLGLKIVTLAPECVDTATIKELVNNNVKVCLGHSNADYSQTKAALDAGATGFTHLFNAMSALHAREPNMVGGALLDDNSWCGIILDGHHVHPHTAKIAYRAKAARKMFLVTDSMSTIGGEQINIHFDGHDIDLVGDKLTSRSGQLAGSALTMMSAVNNAVAMLDVSPYEAMKMASLYPAEFLGIAKSRGQIHIGACADFTLLSGNYSSYKVASTWIGGNRIF